MPHPNLSPKQARFVELYATKGTNAYGNATEAYRQTYDVAKTSEASIGRQAHALVNNSKIAAILNQAVEQSVQSVVFDRIDVLRHLVEVVEADPSKISHVRRICCRYCHGITHKYQWRDTDEYWQAVAAVMDRNARREQEHAKRLRRDADAARDPDEVVPSDEGGYGWRRPAKPHPDCPQCYGEGEEDVYFADMSTLTGPERRLIAGVKRTKDGLEVKMRDQDGALTTIAQILKMLVNKSEVSGPDGGPIPVAGVLAVLPVDANQAAQAYQRLMEGGVK